MRKDIRHEIEARLYQYAQNEATKGWQAIIDTELKQLTDQQAQLFDMRYREKKSEREICRSLHIERATYYRMITDIVQGIALLAAYYKMINPEV